MTPPTADNEKVAWLSTVDAADPIVEVEAQDSDTALNPFMLNGGE